MEKHLFNSLRLTFPNSAQSSLLFQHQNGEELTKTKHYVVFIKLYDAIFRARLRMMLCHRSDVLQGHSV